MEPTVKIGFFGCGNVGSGVWKLLNGFSKELTHRTGLRFEVKRALVRDVHKKREIDLPEGVLTASRDGEEGAQYVFYMNFDHEARTVVPLDGCRDLITGEAVTGPIELAGLSGVTLVRNR